MIVMTLAVYLCISGLVLLPFVLRYAYVVRREKGVRSASLLDLSSMVTGEQGEGAFSSRLMRHL